MAEAAGLINIYSCRTCGWKATTRNRDAGTTPMFLACENCRGTAASACYENVPDTAEPTHEWFKPKTAGERKKILTPAMAEHVALGGLLLRKLVN